MLALSGDLERAEQLQQSSYKMWTTCGIEPEEFDYSTMKITYPGYELRPEIIESTYYLYYFTGEAAVSRHGPDLRRQPGEILPHRRRIRRAA